MYNNTKHFSSSPCMPGNTPDNTPLGLDIGFMDALDSKKDAVRALRTIGMLPSSISWDTAQAMVPADAAAAWLAASTDDEQALHTFLATILAKASANAAFTDAHTALRTHLHQVLPGFFVAHPAADAPARPTSASTARWQGIRNMVRGPQSMDEALADIRRTVLDEL